MVAALASRVNVVLRQPRSFGHDPSERLLLGDLTGRAKDCSGSMARAQGANKLARYRTSSSYAPPGTTQDSVSS